MGLPSPERHCPSSHSSMRLVKLNRSHDQDLIRQSQMLRVGSVLRLIDKMRMFTQFLKRFSLLFTTWNTRNLISLSTLRTIIHHTSLNWKALSLLKLSTRPTWEISQERSFTRLTILEPTLPSGHSHSPRTLLLWESFRHSLSPTDLMFGVKGWAELQDT